MTEGTRASTGFRVNWHDLCVTCHRGSKSTIAQSNTLGVHFEIRVNEPALVRRTLPGLSNGLNLIENLPEFHGAQQPAFKGPLCLSYPEKRQSLAPIGLGSKQSYV